MGKFRRHWGIPPIEPISIGRVGGETPHSVRLLDAYGPQPEAQPR
jgi:hypothetical protein